jgi:hypothetical protein
MLSWGDSIVPHEICKAGGGAETSIHQGKPRWSRFKLPDVPRTDPAIQKINDAAGIEVRQCRQRKFWIWGCREKSQCGARLGEIDQKKVSHRSHTHKRSQRAFSTGAGQGAKKFYLWDGGLWIYI